MSRTRLIAALAAAVAVAGCTGSDPATPPAGPQPDPCAFRTAGLAWLAYASAASGTWDVAVVRADGTCKRIISGGASTDLDPAWAPSGIVAYDSDRAPLPSVWIQQVETGAERRLDVGPTLRATSPAFSPDGQTLAFEGRYLGSITSSIYLVPAAGGTPTELTPEATPHGNGGPAFSPDGATVYFVSNRNGPYDVFAVPAAGGAAVPVTTGSGILGKPAVSPDGLTLAFTRSTLTSTEIALHDLVGGTTIPLAVADASDPAFDPAGGRLVARVMHGGHANIDLLPLSGGDARVTFGAGPDGAPAFAPLGP